MSNQAYLQGVAETLSQLNVDPQIKVASYNELEKVALQGLRAGAKKLVEGGAAKLLGKDVGAAREALKMKSLTMPAFAGGEAAALRDAMKNRGILGAAGRMAERRAQGLGDLGLGAVGAGALTAAGLGISSALDDSDEIAAAQAQALAAAQAEEEAAAERQRNLALALGGTAALSGLGYGAYKALS